MGVLIGTSIGLIISFLSGVFFLIQSLFFLWVGISINLIHKASMKDPAWGILAFMGWIFVQALLVIAVVTTPIFGINVHNILIAAFAATIIIFCIIVAAAPMRKWK
jgi:hypothetical protein